MGHGGDVLQWNRERFMAKHDPGYKRLFSEPEMVRDLLLGFVPGEWVQRLELSSLEKVNASFVSDDLLWREDDVIWRVRFANQSWLYVYLLLEFQSKPDPWMPLRIMVYTGLLWQELIQTGKVKRGQQLPPVVPVVLYNGLKPWTVSEELQDLVVPIDGLEGFRPNCRYLLIDEQRFTTEGEQAASKNLVAALIQLEQSRTPADVRLVVERLVEWLAEPEQSSLRQAFLTWLLRVLLPARLGEKKVPEVNELSEVRVMLAERVIEWTKEWKEQGLAEGKAEGKAEERARSVLKFLEFRGVPVSEEARNTILECKDLEQLDLWLERAMTVDDLEKLFEPR